MISVTMTWQTRLMRVLNFFYMQLVVPEVHQNVSIFTIIVLGYVKFDEGLCFQFLWRKRTNLRYKYNHKWIILQRSVSSCDVWEIVEMCFMMHAQSSR